VGSLHPAAAGAAGEPPRPGVADRPPADRVSLWETSPTTLVQQRKRRAPDRTTLPGEPGCLPTSARKLTDSSKISWTGWRPRGTRGSQSCSPIRTPRRPGCSPSGKTSSHQPASCSFNASARQSRCGSRPRAALRAATAPTNSNRLVWNRCSGRGRRERALRRYSGISELLPFATDSPRTSTSSTREPSAEIPAPKPWMWGAAARQRPHRSVRGSCQASLV
jgi:hypothetical protein